MPLADQVRSPDWSRKLLAEICSSAIVFNSIAAPVQVEVPFSRIRIPPLPPTKHDSIDVKGIPKGQSAQHVSIERMVRLWTLLHYPQYIGYVRQVLKDSTWSPITERGIMEKALVSGSIKLTDLERFEGRGDKIKKLKCPKKCLCSLCLVEM